MKKLTCYLLLGMAATATAWGGTPLWMRDVRISPDGTQIAFCYKGDLYKVNAQGGEAVRLTSQSSYESSPVWSPDGKQIAFASDRYGNMDVFVMPADGGSAKRLTYNSASEVPTAFSPDGKKVYFNAALQDPASSALFPTSAMTELYAVPATGGRTEQILATPAEMINFLPQADGSFLYQDRKGFEDEWRKHHTSSVTRDIWRYDAATGRHTNLTNRPGEDRNPILADNGSDVFFLSERNGGSFNVWRMKLDNPQEAQPVTTFKTHPVRFLSQAKGTLCYTYDGEIYTMMPGKQPKKVAINVVMDNQVPAVQKRSWNNGAREIAVAPNGKEFAVVVRGDVFVANAEFGTTTGRPRRCGWLDILILKFAVRVNGLTALAINKLDTLTGIEKLKVCVAYEKDGQRIYDFPTDISELEGCKPVYIELDGWKEDITGAKSFDEVPAAAKAYIECIEKESGCPVKMVGVGPDREQNLYR